MVEEIDRRVRKVLGRLADYAPWMFAVTVVIFVVLAGWASSPTQKVIYPTDMRIAEYWKTEARLRIEIDRNLKKTAELLSWLSSEMDKENYDAETLLAQIREKRLELQELMEDLVNLRRKIASCGGERTWQVTDEG
jgi:hypothetical protein